MLSRCHQWHTLKITALAVILSLLAPLGAHADLASDISAKQQQIQQLQAQIEEYQAQANAVGQQSQTLQNAIAKLNSQIKQINLQIQSLQASIDQTNLEVTQTNNTITRAQSDLERAQAALGTYLQSTYENDQQSLAVIILNNNSLSTFFDYVHDLQLAQDNARLSIDSIRQLQDNLDQQREDLMSRQNDLSRLKTLQQMQQQELASTKNGQSRLLVQTKGQESKYQQLVKQGQQDLARLREEISFLLQGGLTLENAVSYAKLAAIGSGIRPAFLLALLETESRLGKNVGTGNWKDDMYLCYQRLASFYPSKRQHYLNRAETEKNAFMAVIGKLGLNPDTVKVSKEPSYGCGGAMGPAQFIPSTWLGYEAEVIRITGHNPPNPWNFQDAFTASAAKLARGGATSKDRAGEIRAAKAYISGNPSCTSVTCNNYANTIQQKAAAIEQDL